MNIKTNLFRFLSLLILLIFLIPSTPLYATDTKMENYCIVPPYVKRDVKPNILILMDNDYVMNNQAYTDSYSSSTTYNGYFRSDLWYTYSGNQFVPDASGAFNGNLLNWATTSKYDLLESILVGGRSRSRQTHINTLVSMSNSWSKTYSNCIFQVNNGNLTITEATNGACVLLNTPPTSLTYNKSEQTIKLASLERKIATFFFAIINDVFDLLSTEASAAPLRISHISNQTITNGVPFTLTVTGNGGSGSNYSWSATGLPPGLSIGASGTPTTTISGTPTAVSGYNVTVTLTDSAGATDTETFTITVSAAAPGIRSSNFNIWVCVGDYTNNCNAGTAPTKEGIVDMFWDQARFGLEDFTESGSTIDPNIGAGTCIPASPKENFLTGIENATSVGSTTLFTPLVNGIYTAIDYYKNNTSANCNPFSGTETCLKSFILMITSGEGADNPDYPNSGTENVYTDATNCGNASYYNLTKNACYGYSNDLRTDNTTYPGKQNVITYIVNTMGTGTCSGAGLLCSTILSQAANAGGGTFYNVTDPVTLKSQLIQAFQDILKRASAGTAASVLASGEGSGANLLQAIFYPRKKFYNSATSQYDEIMWPGRLSNMWYYVDPFFTDSTILDDSGTSPSDKILNLSNDKKVTLRFDPTTETTVADRYSFGSTTKIDTIPFESVINLWEAGLELWKRDISTNPRTIYTTTDGTTRILFSTANTGVLRPYLDLSTDDLDPVADGYADGDLDRDGDVDDTDASILIRYIHGEDSATINSTYTWLRSRTVAVDLNGDGDTSDTVSGVSESAKVWKLGDILNSTPKISSWIKLNSYDEVYRDTTYGNANTDPKSGFIYSSNYTGRGMVYTGGNDGMLHAFKLGMLEQEWEGQTTTQKARLTGTDLGKEIWAFIPKNVLPYLKYIKEPGYCHVYTVDFTPYIFDASINGLPTDTKTSSSWRTVLIGGMRLGGACKNTCADSDSDCIQTPATNLGYSSYFALDITDQNNPTLLWEFSNENLGLTTTGPAVVRISARTDGNPDNNKNGHWFVVLASGPTGTVSTTDQQFLGRSNQNLRVFILNLKTGELVRTIDTGISNAFAGSMLNTTHDSDLDYQDDAIYIPYVKKAGDGTWTQGGVSRLLTKEDTDPSNWEWSKVIDDIGPVTSAVVRLQHKSKGILYLFFGTGRYYFEQSSTVDDGTNQRHLFGITEPCYDSNGSGSTSEIKGAFKSSCTSENRSMGQLSQVDLTSASGVSDDEGWYIALDTVSTGYRTERVITDPLSTTSGQVFFTTYKPYDDVCAYGGKSYIWAVKYDTGGSLGSLLRGKALLQTSTGSIEQIDLATAFTEKGGRRTSAIEGVPPTSQGLSLLTTPPPVKRIIHMRER